MSYREKIAWLSLAAMALTFGPYFARVAMVPPGDALPNLAQLTLLAVVATTQMLIQGGGRWYLKRTSGPEASTHADERDRSIERRSVRSAYYSLIAGTIVVGCVLPFTSSGWAIVNAALLAIVVAECVHYGVAVSSYRVQAS